MCYKLTPQWVRSHKIRVEFGQNGTCKNQSLEDLSFFWFLAHYTQARAEKKDKKSVWEFLEAKAVSKETVIS